MALRAYILRRGETFQLIRSLTPPVQGVSVAGGQEAYALPPWGVHPVAGYRVPLHELPTPYELDTGMFAPREDALTGAVTAEARAIPRPPLLDAVAVYLDDDAYPLGLDYDYEGEKAATRIWGEHSAVYSSYLHFASRAEASRVLALGQYLPIASAAAFVVLMVALLWRIGVL